MHRLPNYARRVEYLESTGTQWIDTGIMPSSKSGNVLVVDSACTGGNSVGCLFGVTSKNPGRYYQLNKTTTASQFRLITNSGDVFYTKDSSFYSARHEYKLEANKLYIDGSLLATGKGQADQNGNMFLFARNDQINGIPTGLQVGKWRIYSVKYTRSSTLVRSFVPCRVGQTGYLFDEVTGAFFGNSGTGNFVLGTDVAGGVSRHAVIAPPARRAEGMTRSGSTIRPAGGPSHERVIPALAPSARRIMEGRHAA